MIDFEPTEEQALIIETVRQFAENEIRPQCREADESGAPSPAVLSAAHELGLVANALPEAHGGGGERSAVTGVLIAEELAWGDLAIALAILSPGLLGLPVADFGTESPSRRRCFRASSAAPSCPVPRRSSSRASTSTSTTRRRRPRRDGDEFVLDGVKCQVPWLEGTKHAVVIAAQGDALAGFVVATDAAGLGAEPELNLGLNGLPTVELTLAGVRIPASSRLDADDAAIRGLIDRGRIAVAAAALGTARAAFEVSRDYAKERETFGQPIATRQAIAFKLADMAIEIDGARLLIWEAAAALDRGERRRPTRATRLRPDDPDHAPGRGRRRPGLRRPRLHPRLPAGAPPAQPRRPPELRDARTRLISRPRAFGDRGPDQGPAPKESPRLTRPSMRHDDCRDQEKPMAIDFELSEATPSTQEHYHDIADEQMRPISRKYDLAEHTLPDRVGRLLVEAKVARARPSDPGRERRLRHRSACRPRSSAGATPVSTCACRRPRSAARPSVPRAPRNSARSFSPPSAPKAAIRSGARWRSPSRRRAPTPRRSRRPPTGTKRPKSGCSTARRSSAPPAKAPRRSTAASSSSGRRSTRAPGAAASSPSS